MNPAKFLLIDADVLIDYANSELRVLEKASKYIGKILVARPLLAEVDQLDEASCKKLGLRLIDPSLEQLVESGMHRGALSFTDHLSLVLARDRKLICVTNDQRLRRACSDEGVKILWGLELMVQLVSKRRLSRLAAMKVAKKIHLANPHHIGQTILRRFELRLRDIEHGREQ